MIPHIELSFLNIYEIEIFITNAVQGYHSGNMNVQNKKTKTMINVIKGHGIFL